MILIRELYVDVMRPKGSVIVSSVSDEAIQFSVLDRFAFARDDDEP